MSLKSSLQYQIVNNLKKELDIYRSLETVGDHAKDVAEKIIAEAKTLQTELVIAEVDLKEVDIARNAIGAWKSD